MRPRDPHSDPLTGRPDAPSGDPARASREGADRPMIHLGDRLMPADAPALRADDRGFLYGDGIFETIRALDGRPRHLDRHLERLGRALREAGIGPVDSPALARRIDALLTANRLQVGEAVIRVTFSRGVGGGPRPPAPGVLEPTVLVTARRPPPDLAHRRDGVRLRRVPGFHRALPALKSLCYLPAVLAFAGVAPDEEPLFVDADGAALEGATCNVFALCGDALLTPPADGALLPGVARGLLIERAAEVGLAVRTAPLDPATLDAADGLLVSNALLPVAPVRALDGRPVPDAETGRLAPRLRTLLERDDPEAGHG